MTGRFRRRREVLARRLPADRVWVTSRDSWLSGHAGDWWVEGPEGSTRTVSAEEFPKLYAPIEGDRYRRHGDVTARKVDRQETVHTLEGDGIAHPGMWIVTDESGNSWPVPGEEFNAGYEPTPD